MATKKGKLDFKMVLIIVLTIGLAITIYTLTTQNMANRSSAGWKPGGPLPTKTFDNDNTKACKASCDREEQYCKNAAKNALSSCRNYCGRHGDPQLITECKLECTDEYMGNVNSCKSDANACKKDCK